MRITSVQIEFPLVSIIDPATRVSHHKFSYQVIFTLTCVCATHTGRRGNSHFLRPQLQNLHLIPSGGDKVSLINGLFLHARILGPRTVHTAQLRLFSVDRQSFSLQLIYKYCRWTLSLPLVRLIECHVPSSPHCCTPTVQLREY
jgi:hypothetical protein